MWGSQFTLATPGNSLRYNTHCSGHHALPSSVPGDLGSGRGLSHQSAVYWALRNALGFAYRDRPKSVVGNMRGVE